MQARSTLAIVACLAVSVLGLALWLSNPKPPPATETVPSTAARRDERPAVELARGDESGGEVDRASVTESASDVVDASATGAQELPPSATGKVHGRVLDQDGVTVPTVTLILRRGHVDESRSSDAGGRYAFEGLSSGVYRLDVDGRSLPEALLPPWRQQVAREYDGRPTGIFGTVFRLSEGDQREVDVRVFSAASVRGRVVGPDRLPVPDAVVSIRSTAGISHSAKTDAHGAFDFARVYPVAYTTKVAFASDRAPSVASAPLPMHFELAPGETRTLEDLVAGVGGHVLRGSVVDEVGQPVVGIDVVCEEDELAGRASLWGSRTDAAGRYEIGRVPSSVLVVRVGSSPITDAGANAPFPSKHAPPIRVDTRLAPEFVDVETIAVESTHPFRLTGRVRMDPTWAARNDAERSTIRVFLQEAGEADGRAPEPLVSDEPFAPETTRNFAWSCATPRGAVELRVVLTNDQGIDHVRKTVVRPVADATEDVLVEFR